MLGELFTVALPNGETRQVNLETLSSSVIVPFTMNANLSLQTTFVASSISAESQEKQQDPPESRGGDLVAFFALYKPRELEATLFRGTNGFDISFFKTCYGVHVDHACFSGPSNMIQHGDLILSVTQEAGSASVASISHLKELLQQPAMQVEGAALSLKLLRKQPTIAEKCPQGDVLFELTAWLYESLMKTFDRKIAYKCRLCEAHLFRAIKNRFFVCQSCTWVVCESCISVMHEKLSSKKTMNKPNWESYYSESLNERVLNDLSDIGKVLRIFITGKIDYCDWWLGEIRDFSPEVGHTLVYEQMEEQSSANPSAATAIMKETIPHLAEREYRILKENKLESSPSARNEEKPVSEQGQPEKEKMMI